MLPILNDVAFVLFTNCTRLVLSDGKATLCPQIQEGAVFRAIDQWGNLKTRALTPQSVNAIVKKRCALAGLDPQDFSAHGLRSGFLTEAANRDIPIQDAMLQSRHRSLAQASSYYSDAGRSRRRSARLLG